MASLAGSRETAADVIGICRPCVVCLVAAIAGSGQCRVVVVHVALRAGHSDMRSGQGERRCVVIEGCSSPIRRRVASGACGREANSDVIGAGRPGVIGLVARIAISWDRRVIVVRVALCAC